MLTLLISGSGTGVGKTHVVAVLARAAHQSGRTVQIIKPVQTGVAASELTDADIAGNLAGVGPANRHTLRRFSPALAPMSAAAVTGKPFTATEVVQELLALPKSDVRLVEGAGGLAVPLGPKGWDWLDFAEAIRADAIVLVVPDELGAINQSRLVFDYLKTKSHGRVPGGIFLNALRPSPVEVKQSTRNGLAETGVPLWGELGLNVLKPRLRAPLSEWLGT